MVLCNRAVYNKAGPREKHLEGVAHEALPIEGDEVVGKESAVLCAGRHVLVHHHLPIQQRHVVRVQQRVLAHQLLGEPHLHLQPVAYYSLRHWLQAVCHPVNILPGSHLRVVRPLLQ